MQENLKTIRLRRNMESFEKISMSLNKPPFVEIPPCAFSVLIGLTEQITRQKSEERRHRKSKMTFCFITHLIMPHSSIIVGKYISLQSQFVLLSCLFLCYCL